MLELIVSWPDPTAMGGRCRVIVVDLALRLAAEGLICSPGSAFGSLGEGHLRFNYATGVQEIERGMEILERVTKNIPQRAPRERALT